MSLSAAHNFLSITELDFDKALSCYKVRVIPVYWHLQISAFVSFDFYLCTALQSNAIHSQKS